MNVRPRLAALMSHSFPWVDAPFCAGSREVPQDTQELKRAEDIGAISSMEYVHGNCRCLV